MRLLFLLFILLPIMELVVLIQVGSEIGALPTIGLVLLAAAVGMQLLRRQSMGAFLRARSSMADGELPGQGLVEGFLIGFGGILLIIPGFITDIVAIPLLIPWTRRALTGWLLRNGRMQAFGQSSHFTFTRFGGSRFTGVWPPHGGGQASDVFEGEFTRERAPGDRLKGPPDA